MRTTHRTEEFLIEGVDEQNVLHTWTRNNLSGAKGLADNLVDNHGYKSAKVFNIFGGDKSDALHVRVQPIVPATETQS
jgi:hypothetical protein